MDFRYVQRAWGGMKWSCVLAVVACGGEEATPRSDKEKPDAQTASQLLNFNELATSLQDEDPTVRGGVVEILQVGKNGGAGIDAVLACRLGIPASLRKDPSSPQVETERQQACKAAADWGSWYTLQQAKGLPYYAPDLEKSISQLDTAGMGQLVEVVKRGMDADPIHGLGLWHVALRFTPFVPSLNLVVFERSLKPEWELVHDALWADSMIVVRTMRDPKLFAEINDAMERSLASLCIPAWEHSGPQICSVLHKAILASPKWSFSPEFVSSLVALGEKVPWQDEPSLLADILVRAEGTSDRAKSYLTAHYRLGAPAKWELALARASVRMIPTYPEELTPALLAAFTTVPAAPSDKFFPYWEISPPEMCRDVFETAKFIPALYEKARPAMVKLANVPNGPCGRTPTEFLMYGK